MIDSMIGWGTRHGQPLLGRLVTASRGHELVDVLAELGAGVEQPGDTPVLDLLAKMTARQLRRLAATRRR